MSFLTGTNTELISSQAYASGTNYSSSTTATAVNNGNGAAYLPIGFFYTNVIGKKLRVVADGLYSTSSAAPTLQLGVALDTVLGTLSSNTFLSGAITTATSVSSGMFHLDTELCVSTLTEASGSSTGTTANIMGLGWVALQATGIASTTAGSVYGIGTTALVSVAVNQAYFVEIYAKWGSANSSNILILENVSVYGCN